MGPTLRVVHATQAGPAFLAGGTSLWSEHPLWTAWAMPVAVLGVAGELTGRGSLGGDSHVVGVTVPRRASPPEADLLCSAPFALAIWPSGVR